MSEKESMKYGKIINLLQELRGLDCLSDKQKESILCVIEHLPVTIKERAGELNNTNELKIVNLKHELDIKHTEITVQDKVIDKLIGAITNQ